ncbi:Zinc finger CCHC retroviral-type protein [Macrophomina phaseolina MS6]|uniref:Zinc finger CCHC retroviral-type protein n=1 Tax=Macrophomina phaseolina (strain MS6) TaxID=1126212 RepID=K2RV77_MACPH|nr:Zinc finger CCHC retroviral-type protein [Macrophomina phaseolina MS6]
MPTEFPDTLPVDCILREGLPISCSCAHCRRPNIYISPSPKPSDRDTGYWILGIADAGVGRDSAIMTPSEAVVELHRRTEGIHQFPEASFKGLILWCGRCLTEGHTENSCTQKLQQCSRCGSISHLLVKCPEKWMKGVVGMEETTEAEKQAAARGEFVDLTGQLSEYDIEQTPREAELESVLEARGFND